MMPAQDVARWALIVAWICFTISALSAARSLFRGLKALYIPATLIVSALLALMLNALAKLLAVKP